MVSAAIVENYEIEQNLKKYTSKRPDFFILDPCFLGWGMQWSYRFRSTILVTTWKFKMAVEINV